MKELSQQSLYKIRDVIPGQNYANIKARLDQYLPLEYSSIFSKVSFASDKAYWFGNDDIEYKTYVEASAIEKEEIAAVLEECKQFACTNLKTEMPFIERVFIIPSTDEIFWYRDNSGITRVLLTQWGFQKKQIGQDVDIIDLLIGAPRTLTQDDVTIKFYFSDGEIAKGVPFVLSIFNNKKECASDEKGEYYVGKLYDNKTFSVEDSTGENHFDFIVKKGAEYNVTFDWETAYKVLVENQFGQNKSNFKIIIDDQELCTDDNGEYHSDKLVLTKGKKISVSLPNESNSITYSLDRDEENNVFKYVVNEPIVTPPDPPEPPKYVSVHLFDSDGTPLPYIPFRIISKGEKDIECVTDENGIGKFLAERMSHGKKYKITFQITPEQRDALDEIKSSNNGQK